MVPAHAHDQPTKKRVFAMGSVLLVATLLAGCGFLFQDTCSGGQNMTEPYVAEPFDAFAPAPELAIGWSLGTGPGAYLPETYFEAVHFAYGAHEPDVAALLLDVRHDAPGRIVVTFAPLADYLASSTGLAFDLEFPDRRRYISCRHPASDDRYLLRVDLGFGAGGTVESVTFEERVILGPF